jgi:cytidine deaminase
LHFKFYFVRVSLLAPKFYKPLSAHIILMTAIAERQIYAPSPESPVSELSDADRLMCLWLVRQAREARANPTQSGYFVRTAAITEDGTLYTGGNKEDSLEEAFVHGEEAVVSGLYDRTDSPIKALAWYHNNEKGDHVTTPGDIGSPCGHCRDVMLDYCSPNMFILNGNETGVVYLRLRDYLFERYRELDNRELDRDSATAAARAIDHGVEGYLPDAMKKKMYGAVLVSEDGNMWPGAHFTNAAFDAAPPVFNALQYWRNYILSGKGTERDLHLTKLVIAGRGDSIPHVLYRDRQVMLEEDEVLRQYRGDNTPLEVQIIQLEGQGATAYQTNVVEWLPFPFSPKAFGMEKNIDDEVRKLTSVK